MERTIKNSLFDYKGDWRKEIHDRITLGSSYSGATQCNDVSLNGFQQNFAQNSVTFATKKKKYLGGEKMLMFSVELCIIKQNCFQQKIERTILIPQLRKNIQINIKIPRDSL